MACLITLCDSLGYSEIIFYIWIYFWTYFWAIFWLRKLDFLLPLVSIRIRITDVLACLTLPTDSFWYSKFKYHIWIYSWDNFGSLLATFGLRRTKNGITNNFKTVESLCSTYLSHNIKDPSLLILWQIYNVF